MRRLSIFALLPVILAPASAFAQAAPALALPTSATGWLALVGIGSLSALGLLLFHKLAGPALTWLATKEVPIATAAVKTKIATSAEGMDHPEAVAIVNHQVDNLGADVSAALIKAGADFSNLSTLSGASLLAVAKDAETTFMAGIDEAQLLAALEALGQAEGGNVLAWVKKTIIGIIHPVPSAPTTSLKTVITTADGTHVVAPAPVAVAS
jgi:hypothetical protein